MKALLTSLPNVIREASSSWLGMLALMVCLLAGLAYAFFGQNAGEAARVSVFLLLFLGVSVFAGIVVRRASLTSGDGAVEGRSAAPSEDARAEAPMTTTRRPWVAVMDLISQTATERDEPQSFGVSSFLRRVLEEVPMSYRFGVVPTSELMGIEKDQISKQQIRKRTGARFVLEGSIDLRGNPCMIEVKLSRTVEEDSVLWRHTYVEPWEEIQSVVKKIAGEVVETVLRHTTPRETDVTDDINQIKQIFDAIPTQPINVFEAFNRGIFNQNRFNNLRRDKDFLDAEYHLTRAVSDADFTNHDALAQLGFLYLLRWETDSHSKWLKQSEEKWNQILGIDNEDRFALVEYAYVSFVRGSKGAVEAVQTARKAVALEPQHAIAQNVLALLYLYLGYFEANVIIEETEVFPLAPTYVYPRTNAALAQQLRGFHEEALELALKAREIDPRAFVANLLVGAQHFYLGKMREAEHAWLEGKKHCAGPVASILDVTRAWVRAREGDLSAARETLSANTDAPWLNGPYGPYFISLCALAGDAERAISLLSEQRTFARSYRYLVSEPTLRPLRRHSAFKPLLEARYAEWQANLAALEAGLANPVGAVIPTPDELVGGAP